MNVRCSTIAEGLAGIDDHAKIVPLARAAGRLPRMRRRRARIVPESFYGRKHRSAKFAYRGSFGGGGAAPASRPYGPG